MEFQQGGQGICAYNQGTTMYYYVPSHTFLSSADTCLTKQGSMLSTGRQILYDGMDMAL